MRVAVAGGSGFVGRRLVEILREGGHEAVVLTRRVKRARRRLSEERLERAIGVVYRPATELESHYFTANLARQFDEWVWLDETRAVDALDVTALEGMPQTYPFGT